MVIQQQPSSLSDRPQVSSMVKSRRRSVSPVEPSYRLAQALVKQEKWQEAIAAYQQALIITPNWVEVQRELGDLFLKLERWDEAVQVYETAISLRSESAEVYHNLGDALLKLQRWEDAIAAYEKAIELNPEFSWSYNNLGDGLRELQRWDEAAQAYGKAIELKPDFALSHHNLGDVLVKKEDWEGAIAAYQKAIELDPNFIWSSYNLGDVLVKKEDWENAIAAYRSAVKLDPNLPQVHEKLGDALRHHSQIDSKEISQVYHRAVEQNPTDLQVYYKALEVNPQDAEMSLKLADTLRNQGKLEQAITFYKSTLQIDPNNPEIQAVAWEQLGDVLRKLGKDDKVVGVYRTVITQNIVLFTPYYKAKQPERQDELIYCLKKNIECPEIEKIVLLIDDGYQPELESPKIEIIQLSSRATYLDWIELTEKKFPDKISVLANTDIYLDESIFGLREIFSANPNGLVALSRREQKGSEQILHENPHQSQDVWAVCGDYKFTESLKKSLSVPLGLPRCDAKIAYLFSVHGAKVYNPCNHIKIVHVHETQLRSYDKYGDTTILGSTAWVYPSENLSQPSKLKMNVWTLNPDEVENIQINNSLIRWREEQKDQDSTSMTTALQSDVISAILEKSQEKIRQFHNKHLGERCVIIGNGPSLNEMDLSFLKDEICFGTNKIFLGFERWNFSPTYYVAVNPHVIEQSVDQIRNIFCPKFIGNRGVSFFAPSDDLIFIKTFPSPGEAFSKYPDVGLNEGSTVTYVAMQLAYYMGFSEVILIGVDHHFVTQGTPYEAIVSEGNDPNHFDPNYFGKGLKWQLPDLDASEKSYRVAKKVFEESGRKIIDATVNGQCQVFPKQDYQEVFQRYFQKLDSTLNDHLNHSLNSELQKEEKQLIKQHPFPHQIFLPTNKISIKDRVRGLKKVIEIYKDTYQSFYKQKLIELKERFKNYDRVFIIGNGPSLNYTDLELLNNEVTFGVNGIFLKSQDTGWKPTFYVVEDHLVAEDRQDAINKYEGSIKLFPISLAYCLKEGANTLFFDHRPRISYPDGYDFSTDASFCTYTGCTVTYTCIQLAYFLGFKNIYLIGVDASYAIPKDVKIDQEYQTEILDMKSDDVNHFHPDYFGKGYRWHDPQVHKMMEAYKEARKVCNQNDVNIFNATIGGKLDVFPRVNYYDLFNHNDVYPRLLIIDMTKLGSLSATGQIKEKLLANWSTANWLQIYVEDDNLRLFSKADFILDKNRDKAINEAKIIEECIRFSPKVIYYRPVADKPFLHTLACKVIEKLGASLVIHIMDDWLERLSHQNSQLYSKFDRSIRLLLKQSATRLSICDAMSVAFQNRYGLDFIPIANSVHPNDWINISQKDDLSKLRKSGEQCVIRYIGSLADDMNFISICDLVDCITQLGRELSVILEIYTHEFYLQKASNKFLNLPNIKVYESNFSEEKYRQLLCNADILIIAYNFDEESIRYVKYSMANKLPECLASGTPVLAYGPMEVATISYLVQTEVVKTVTERNLKKLSLVIHDLVTNPSIYQEMGQKAQKFAFHNHGSEKTCHTFYSILRKAALNPQPVKNLVSSILDFNLVSGFARDEHARINVTELVFEFLHENINCSTVVNISIDQSKVLDQFAKNGWEILNLHPNVFSKPGKAKDIEESTSETLSVDICYDNNLKKIEFLRIDTEGCDLMILKDFPWENLEVNFIECKFEDEITVPFGYTFHDIAQYLAQKGYIIAVSEWYPRITSNTRYDSWYRLQKYPCELASVQSWGNIIAFKTEPNWQSILDMAKKVLQFEYQENRNVKYHVENADNLEREGKIEEAIQEIEMALDIEPEKMELHYKMGELLLKQKRFKDAKIYYQKVIEIKPDYFWALRGLGDILKEDGNLKDALLLYHQAIEINPSYFYGYDKIGRILQVQGDFSQAITYFRKALEIKTDATITLKALEECLDQQRKKKIN